MTTSSPISRSRGAQFVGIVFIIALGLASRSFALFPAAFGKYPGDVLWALMVFVGLGFIFATSSTVRVGLAALAISYGVEFAKFYHGEWLEAFRGTPLGRLVLGYVFSVGNLVCYTFGVGMGVLIEMGIARARSRVIQP